MGKGKKTVESLGEKKSIGKGNGGVDKKGMKEEKGRIEGKWG